MYGEIKSEPGGSEERPCSSCNHHKGMSNPAKGVRIPGEYGKCTREGGLCDHDDREEAARRVALLNGSGKDE